MVNVLIKLYQHVADQFCHLEDISLLLLTVYNFYVVISFIDVTFVIASAGKLISYQCFFLLPTACLPISVYGIMATGVIMRS